MLSILKSALNANTKEMGIVSNNIANVNSTAFKKSKTNFEHIYSRDRSSDPSKFSGQGVGVNDPLLQMSQGSLKTTNGALDLAITGLGFHLQYFQTQQTFIQIRKVEACQFHVSYHM